MNSILIADSHNLYREALCNYIQHADQNMCVQGFADYASLKNYVINAEVDLILIERNLSGWGQGDFDGIKLGVIVAMADESILVNQSLRGIFPKSLSCKAFLGGIHEILAGRSFFPLAEQGDIVHDYMPAAKKLPEDFSLTVREKEVLAYLVKGQSNKDIARALHLQVVTIKLHVRGICRKMKVSNRTQAALAAQENGWR